MGCMCSTPFIRPDDYESVFQTREGQNTFLGMPVLNATACELRSFGCRDFIQSFGSEILHMARHFDSSSWCVCIASVAPNKKPLSRISRQQAKCTDELQLIHLTRFVYAIYRRNWGFLAQETRAALYPDIQSTIEYNSSPAVQRTEDRVDGFVSLRASQKLTYSASPRYKVPNCAHLLCPEDGIVKLDAYEVKKEGLSDDKYQMFFDILTLSPSAAAAQIKTKRAPRTLSERKP